MKWLEQWAVGRVRRRVMAGVAPQEKKELEELLGRGEQNPTVAACLNVAAGEEERHKELLANREMSPDDRTWRAGAMAGAMMVQEAILALRENGRKQKAEG